MTVALSVCVCELAAPWEAVSAHFAVLVFFLLIWIPLWWSSSGAPPAEVFRVSPFCWQCSDPLPAFTILTPADRIPPQHSSSPQVERTHWVTVVIVAEMRIKVNMMVFSGIKRLECRNSVYSWPRMDLRAPSCWDAPETSAHSGYCAITWTCPQLYNTASVPSVIQSNWDTRGSVSQSDWCSLSYGLILCLVHTALRTWVWLLCLCGSCFFVFLCFLKLFQCYFVLYGSLRPLEWTFGAFKMINYVVFA